MARVKRAVNAHKKRRVVLERASGYRGQRSRLYRKAKEQLLHSFTYNFRDRKARKGDFRKLWIQRINAAVRAEGITYNRFIQGLHLAGIELDRRALAELAVSDPETFKAIVEQAKAALPEDVNAPVPALPRAVSVPCGSGIASSRRETSSIVSTSGSICALLGALTVADTSSLTACCARANRWNSWMLASLLDLLRALSPSESSCATYSSMSALPMASGSVMPRVCASHER